MSPRATRRTLFLAALLLAPLPMFGFDAWLPVARYVLLAAVCVGMRVVEGPGGVVWQLTGLFLAHALVYGLLIWLATRFAERALRSLSSRSRGALVVSGVLGVLVWAIATQPYVTPFGPAARGNLLHVLR